MQLEPLMVFPQSDRWIGDVKFTSDASLVAASTTNEIVAYNVTTRQKQWHISTKGHASVIAFSPDSSLLVAGYSEGTLKVIDVNSGTLKSEVKEHNNYIRALAFSAEGSTLISASEGDKILVWDVKDGSLKTRQVVPLMPGSRRFAICSARGIVVANHTGWMDPVLIYNISSPDTAPNPVNIISSGPLAVSASGEFCAGASDFGSVYYTRIADIDSTAVVNKGHVTQTTYSGMNTVTSIGFSSDDEWLISTSNGNVHFSRPMMRNAHFVFKAAVGHAVWKFDYKPEKKLFAGAISDGCVRIWRVDPTARNTVSPPPTPPRPSRADDQYYSDESFDDPYPWKD